MNRACALAFGCGAALIFMSAAAIAADKDTALPTPNPFSSDGTLIEVEPRTATFLLLDKITARKRIITINSGETVKFGTLVVRMRHCVASAPEAIIREAKVLVEVYENPPGGDGVLKQIFNGWMFASSPAINPLQHAVYDIWPISCKERKPET